METGRQVSDLAAAKPIPVGFKTGGTDQGLSNTAISHGTLVTVPWQPGAV